MAITQQTHTVTRDGSRASCLEFRSVTHVILLSAMHSDDILMKIEMIYVALLEENFFLFSWGGGVLLLQKI